MCVGGGGGGLIIFNIKHLRLEGIAKVTVALFRISGIKHCLPL